jgi:tetratricopeptide (TPR) repeat protein
VVLFLLTALLSSSLAQTGDPAARSRAATQAMSDGRYEDAVRLYRELLQPLPDEPGLLMNLGMALAMAGREAEAIAPLERATTLKPTLIPAQLFLGTSHLALGASDKAIRPLQRVTAAQPGNVEYRQLLARAYAASGRPLEAALQLRQVTTLAPTLPAAWYSLFHAYNAVAQDALATFADEAGSGSWQQLLIADALFADGRLTDAFAAYREALAAMPAMVSIHDSIARIYEQTGHADWAGVERLKGRLSAAQCARRKALCEFRAGRYSAALTAASGKDAESRYWRARAATELTKAVFARLDRLPDSRERREVRAALATAERRHADAVVELKAALKHAPQDPSLLGELGIELYLTRDYEQAVAVLAPLVSATPPLEDARILTAHGDSLLQLDRLDEALPILRRAFTADTSDREASLALARALLRQREFRAALPLLEWQLAGDTDGSVHVQLSRALAGLGEQSRSDALLARSQELQRAAQERAALLGRRAILPPPK